ncbi:UTRA domain-containing protein [Phenylobacterium sp. J367]|uniref:UTRA domain-containing protein n=1 Tax=Phenylobacterium sp. J367 TaxID=2898435 RepID=UPI0027E26000|nr:UTRA domain-containing protein [Phenylobacterium sp. J367]
MATSCCRGPCARRPRRTAPRSDSTARPRCWRCVVCTGRTGAPFGLEERLINLSAAPEVEGVDFAASPPGGWLLAHIPWTEAEHRISAAHPAAGAAKLLGVAATAACLVLERRTWRGDDRITHVRLTFPGEAYDLVARFTPNRG